MTISLHIANNTHCRWPCGEPKELKCCGQKVVRDQSYCAAHMVIAYEKKGKSLDGLAEAFA